MAEVVKSDRSGRIVIPLSPQQELGITENTRFILTLKGHGQVLLQKLDVEGIARKLEEELKERYMDEIVKAVRKEINETIKSNYPDLLA